MTSFKEFLEQRDPEFHEQMLNEFNLRKIATNAVLGAGLLSGLGGLGDANVAHAKEPNSYIQNVNKLNSLENIKAKAATKGKGFVVFTKVGEGDAEGAVIVFTKNSKTEELKDGFTKIHPLGEEGWTEAQNLRKDFEKFSTEQLSNKTILEKMKDPSFKGFSGDAGKIHKIFTGYTVHYFKL